MNGIYIHIPFCRSKCPYCDFYSLCGAQDKNAYVNELIRRIKTLDGFGGYITPQAFNEPADTLYIGGGTPTVLAENELTDITNAVKQSFILTENAEITVEANPSSPRLSSLFSALKKAGVNRVSIGMQSAVDSERRILGRLGGAHSVGDAVTAAKTAGINNISLDVMLGLPGQTVKSLEYTLGFALSLEITHLSCYMLQLEEGTAFYKRRQSLNLPSDDDVGDMYMLMCSYLKNAGMRHYEISSFCFDNNISRHNMKYWQLEPYIGFGAAAHSFYGGNRFYFERDISSFINGAAPVFDGKGGGTDEKIMLSLRTDSGVDSDDVKDKPALPALIKNGLVYSKNNKTVLTEKGMLLSNSVIASLI